MVDLLKLTALDLFEKFGAGEHKPGSGSAAAYEGMLAAKLLLTVILITSDKKRKPTYDAVLDEFATMRIEIEQTIYPTLIDLFNIDADDFNKAIQARINRNNETNIYKKNRLKLEALTLLKPCIETPFKIAQLCTKLAEMGVVIFEKGFKGARGDTQVAISGCVAAIAGCISIIQLNLISYDSNEYHYIIQQNAKLNELKNQYSQLLRQSNDKIDDLKIELQHREELFKQINILKDEIAAKKNYSYEYVEQIASQLQRIIWKNRNTIWKNPPEDYSKILKPVIVLKNVLGYSIEKIPVIDNENVNIETAGTLNQKQKLVVISEAFNSEIQNFTSAHEIGHILFHKQNLLHRDRPVKGFRINYKRSRTEIEADKFATYFLLPGKLIKKTFWDQFQTNQFEINDNTAFALITSSAMELEKSCKNKHDLAMKLAATERYNGANFLSLAKTFNVSNSVMALRLEELELVKY